jgi:hypothetical protein
LELYQRFYGIKKILEPVPRALSDLKKKVGTRMKGHLVKVLLLKYKNWTTLIFKLI